MSRYEVRLAGERQVIEADGFSQVGEYVSFFHRIDGVKTSFALVRMSPSDSIVEQVAKSAAAKRPNECPKLVDKTDSAIVYYGPHSCEVCGRTITKMGREYGGFAYDYPAGPVYPNSEWNLHSCNK